MFDIPDQKIFMDSVHGYISVPKCFVRNLIDTEAFQRLRNVDQTGMRILYPTAKHDRFSHSLGVFHLGCKAVDAFLENFHGDLYWNIRSDKQKDVFWAKNKVLFLIACLLHDIGHAPFSHALEEIILSNSADDENFSLGLIAKLKEKENWQEDIRRKDLKAAPHEQLGAAFVLDDFAPNIEKVYDELMELKYPSTIGNDILYAEYYSKMISIDKSELSRDICFIARMILGLKYTGYEPEKQIRNCFIELLNGSDFDVDKLDYIIRDTQMSGISNINIDVDRLLESVSIVAKTKYIDKEYTQKEFSNRVILDLIGDQNSCLLMKGTFCGTILLQSGAAVTIANGSTFLSMTPVEHTTIAYAEDAEAAKFSEDTKIVRNGKPTNKVVNFLKTLIDDDGIPFECDISNATVKENNFSFVVQEDTSSGLAIRLEINGYCDLRIKGPCRIQSSIRCFDLSLDGNVHELLLLGNAISNKVPSPSAYNEFTVGFKKKAINVIANVLEARDYLYLWIYAHHKVMYYANFLIPTLSREVLRGAGSGDFPLWRLTYKNILHLDDSYIWTAIKYYCQRAEKDSEWRVLCQELLTRKYKISLYKSLAEYDLMFESFPTYVRMDIKQYLFDHCDRELPCVNAAEGVSAGYLQLEIMKELWSLGMPESVTSLIYVDASYKAKRIDTDKTFIVMKQDEVVSVSEIPLLSERVVKSGNTSYYFYLYCGMAAEAEVNQHTLEAIKGALKTHFKNIVGSTICQ